MDDKRFASGLTEVGDIVLIGMFNLGTGQRSIQGGLRCLSTEGWIYIYAKRPKHLPGIGAPQ